jgi:hypothetical protein
VDAARSAEAERLDALRRRLYSPDATPEDRAAYEAAEVAAGAAHPAPADRPAPRRFRAGVLVGAVLLVVAGVAGLVTTHPLTPLTTPSATPAVTATAAAAAAGDERIPAASASRLRFIRALRSGDRAGLLDYLYGHSPLIPAEIRTTGRADSTEYVGLGSSLIALDPSRLAERGGRVTVIIVSDRPATYSWQAERVAQSNDRSGPVVEVASHRGSTRPGEPVSFTFRYGDGAPGRLALQLDDAVRWGAAVVFTD